MLIDLGTTDWVEVPHMNGGEGSVFARMAVVGDTRIVITRMPPASSIGMHLQTSGDDVNHVMEGRGKAICDGKEETLFPGACHVCPRGSEHSIVNDGESDLLLFSVVPVARR